MMEEGRPMPRIARSREDEMGVEEGSRLAI